MPIIHYKFNISITFYSLKCISYKLINQNGLNIDLNSIMDDHRQIQMRGIKRHPILVSQKLRTYLFIHCQIFLYKSH